MKVFSYRGYSVAAFREAYIEADPAEWQFEGGGYLGRIAGIEDCLIVMAGSLEEFENNFHTAIDDYLALCAEIPKQPNAPVAMN